MRVLFLIIATLSLALTIQLVIAKMPQIKVAIMTDAALTPVSETEYATTSSLITLIDGQLVEIPLGFRTTLGVIPRGLLNPLQPDVVESAIVHDYLYHCPSNLTRKEIDAILYHCLINEGVSDYRAKKYWFFARLFGGKYFSKNSSCYPNPDSE